MLGDVSVSDMAFYRVRSAGCREREREGEKKDNRLAYIKGVWVLTTAAYSTISILTRRLRTLILCGRLS